MGMKLEEFFQRKGVPAEHVLDPRRVSDEYEREKLQKDLEAEKKKNAAGSGSDVIDVSGYMKDEKVVKKIEEPKAPIEPPKKPLRETLNIPPYNPQSAPAAPQQAAAPQAQIDRSFPWDRALIGATPLLVGLLTGNQQEGVKTAGDYWAKGEQKLYNDEQTLAMKLAQMKAKREEESGKGSRRYQAQTIALEDGTNVKGVFDTFTGKHLMPDGQEIPSNFIRAGYAVNPEEYDRRKDVASEHKRDDADYLGTGAKTDPVTGELAIVRNGKAVPVQGSPSGKFNKKQEADVTAGIKELKDSDAYKDSVQALSLTPQVSALLDAAGRENDPNSIAGSSVVLTMIRQAQRVGVASDRDASAFGGTQQYMETLERLEDKLLGSGKPFTQRDLNDLREVSSIYTRVAKNRLGSYYSDKRDSFASRFNIDPALIDEQMGTEVRPYMGAEETKIKAANAPVQVVHGGRTWTSPARDKSLAFEMDGKVNFADPKNWELIKKNFPNAKRLK